MGISSRGRCLWSTDKDYRKLFPILAHVLYTDAALFPLHFTFYILHLHFTHQSLQLWHHIIFISNKNLLFFTILQPKIATMPMVTPSPLGVIIKNTQLPHKRLSNTATKVQHLTNIKCRARGMWPQNRTLRDFPDWVNSMNWKSVRSKLRYHTLLFKKSKKAELYQLFLSKINVFFTKI